MVVCMANAKTCAPIDGNKRIPFTIVNSCEYMT